MVISPLMVKLQGLNGNSYQYSREQKSDQSHNYSKNFSQG